MVTDSLYRPYADEEYRKFAYSLSPTDTLERKGIRIPVLRRLSRLVNPDDIEIRYHEDVILSALAIGYSKKPAEEKLEKLRKLLPFLSSWDQTDTIVSAFRPDKDEEEAYLSFFTSLLEEREVFSRRLAIVWLMTMRKIYDRNMLFPLIISCDDEKEYYISMAVAWAVSEFIIEDKLLLTGLDELSPVTRRRAEQKLRDSLRFNPRRSSGQRRASAE